jgi:hypothetical protein
MEEIIDKTFDEIGVLQTIRDRREEMITQIKVSLID